MTESYSIKKRENPFQFFASEFLGDMPNIEALYSLDAKVGALAYVINTGYTYIQAQKGDWKQLKAGKGSTGRPGDRGPEGPAGRDGVDGKEGPQGRQDVMATLVLEVSVAYLVLMGRMVVMVLMVNLAYQDATVRTVWMV